MIPCKDCLVFSLCKARLWDSKEVMHHSGVPLKTYGVVFMADKENCVELSKYIMHHPSSPEQAVNEVREVFGLRQIVYAGGSPTLSTLEEVIKRNDNNKRV